MVVVYTSNTGKTERYAKMFCEKTALSAVKLCDIKSLKKGEEVIFFGWLFAGVVKGLKKAQKRLNVKAVVGVGLGDTGAQDKSVRETNKIASNVPVFTLQGGMDYEKLHGINKFMIDMLKKMLLNKTRTDDEEKMLSLLNVGGDFVCEENLAAVMNWYFGEK